MRVDAVQEKYVVESALFSAGKPLSPEEIAEATELPLAAVKKLIKELAKEYSEREGSIEISQVGAKFAMQLRSFYAVHASKLAQMEIPPHVLKTVALIAYHQPVTQSNLKRLLGAKVYEHVDVLDELGLIRTRKLGQTKILTTTPRFCEYFGISEVSKDGVKSWLAKKVGVKTGAGTIEEFLDKLETQGGGAQGKEAVQETPISKIEAPKVQEKGPEAQGVVGQGASEPGGSPPSAKALIERGPTEVPGSEEEREKRPSEPEADGKVQSGLDARPEAQRGPDGATEAQDANPEAVKKAKRPKGKGKQMKGKKE